MFNKKSKLKLTDFECNLLINGINEFRNMLAQYLNKAADVPYSTLGEYVDLYGYGNPTETIINGKTIKVLPLAHPRQIGALGAHSERWNIAHREWEDSL